MTITRVVMSFNREREHHVGAWGWGGIRTSPPASEVQAISSSHAKSDVLAAADLVDGGNAVRAGWGLVFPQHFAGVLIISSDLMIGSRSGEDQSARCDHRSAARVPGTGIAVSFFLQSRDAAVGNLPSDRSSVQIVSGKVRPRRTHCRIPAALAHEIYRRSIVDEALVVRHRSGYRRRTGPAA